MFVLLRYAGKLSEKLWNIIFLSKYRQLNFISRKLFNSKHMNVIRLVFRVIWKGIVIATCIHSISISFENSFTIRQWANSEWKMFPFSARGKISFTCFDRNWNSFVGVWEWTSNFWHSIKVLYKWRIDGNIKLRCFWIEVLVSLGCGIVECGYWSSLNYSWMLSWIQEKRRKSIDLARNWKFRITPARRSMTTEYICWSLARI